MICWMNRLPSSSRGCALPAKMNWIGPLLVVSEFHDVVELLENQRGAFVSGEAPRKADGQRVGIQQMIEVDVIALARRAGFG